MCRSWFWMSILFLDLCFLFGLLVFVVRISGLWHNIWSSRESLFKLGAGLPVVSLNLYTSDRSLFFWLVWTVCLNATVCTCSSGYCGLYLSHWSLLLNLVCSTTQLWNSSAFECKAQRGAGDRVGRGGPPDGFQETESGTWCSLFGKQATHMFFRLVCISFLILCKIERLWAIQMRCWQLCIYKYWLWSFTDSYWSRAGSQSMLLDTSVFASLSSPTTLC